MKCAKHPEIDRIGLTTICDGWCPVCVAEANVCKVEGTKHDQGKAPLSLIPPVFLFEVARVLAFGSKKYGRFQWTGGMAWSRLLDAAMRHLNQFNEGQDLDEESGISHLAHAACCLAFLITFTQTHKELDDRHKYVVTDEEET